MDYDLLVALRKDLVGFSIVPYGLDDPRHHPLLPLASNTNHPSCRYEVPRHICDYVVILGVGPVDVKSYRLQARFRCPI